mmetsp:Transcript_5281/g.7235  ORF Transcript_5281/g.7235 Transcript_5281/m.7235 type:complete len:255 (-) Transcript_5281:121-885(-)
MKRRVNPCGTLFSFIISGRTRIATVKAALTIVSRIRSTNQGFPSEYIIGSTRCDARMPGVKSLVIKTPIIAPRKCIGSTTASSCKLNLPRPISQIRVGMFGMVPKVFCMGRSNQVEANTKPGAVPAATFRGNRQSAQPANTDMIMNTSSFIHPNIPPPSCIISSSSITSFPSTTPPWTVVLCPARSTRRPRDIRRRQEHIDQTTDDTASLSIRFCKIFAFDFISVSQRETSSKKVEGVVVVGAMLPQYTPCWLG